MTSGGKDKMMRNRRDKSKRGLKKKDLRHEHGSDNRNIGIERRGRDRDE